MNKSKVGYVDNIEEKTQINGNFREVLFTGKFSQLVVMSIEPGEDIGMEIHETVDQFLRVESGTGKAILNGEETNLEDGSAVVVPAGVEHNVVNTSNTEELKLYSIYTPPQHADGTIHKDREEAMIAEAEEHNH